MGGLKCNNQSVWRKIGNLFCRRFGLLGIGVAIRKGMGIAK